VNGRTWPYLQVEQRRYRFRFLNGSQTRFLILTTAGEALTFWQIGSDGGFLPASVPQTQLLLGPAERADVIVDFSAVPAGTGVTLLNLGPDEPFGGGTPGVDFPAADPGTTGQVMQFQVVAATSADTTTPPTNLVLPTPADVGAASNTRPVSLNEFDSVSVCLNARDRPVPCSSPSAVAPFGPVSAHLGTVDGSGNPVPAFWMDAITENPALGSTEVWEIFNFTADAHPIHIHLVQFEILDRQALSSDADGITVPPATLVGDPIPPEAWERGRKDTVISYPGSVTRVKARYDIPGLFVWHCHILEHEDNEMMRPYRIGP
jgi:FtsP/CotA-like multicopper oxidase with cupredoxin domain